MRKDVGKEIFMKNELGDRATDSFMTWLRNIGYYDAPASISHHGNHSGGLFEHSVEVAKQLQLLTVRMNLDWDDPSSPSVIGLLHDICKCDDYVGIGDEDGSCVWEYNKDKLMGGHGDKSVIMLAGRFPLNEQEVQCIRFHMGAYTEKDQWQYYNKAIRKYPHVLWTHTADMLASQVNGI